MQPWTKRSLSLVLMNTLSLKCVSGSALLALFLTSSAAAGEYTFVDLGTLGGTRSFAYGINDRGQIAGFADTSDGRSDSVLYSRGRATDLSPLNSETDPSSIITVGPSSINNRGDIASGVMSGGIYVPAVYESATRRISALGSLGGVTWYGFSGVATAINNSGQVVGYSYLDGINRQAFIYQRGTMTDLGSFGGYSGALDINDLGVAVGFASDDVDGVGVAAMWARGAIIPICGNRESTAYGINNLGQAVGEMLTHDAFHAFVFSRGALRDLGTLRTGRNSTAYHINETGQVVGTADVISSIDTHRDPVSGQIFYQTNYEDHAFLYQNGAMLDLNDLLPKLSGWLLSDAYGVNQAGEIVGWGLEGEESRAFLLTPNREGWPRGPGYHPTPGRRGRGTLTRAEERRWPHRQGRSWPYHQEGDWPQRHPGPGDMQSVGITEPVE